MLADHRSCHPLTVSDLVSRYLPDCDVLSSTGESFAFVVFERALNDRAALSDRAGTATARAGRRSPCAKPGIQPQHASTASPGNVRIEQGGLGASDGARSLVAESMLLKHQLLMLNRSRGRVPNLRPTDRSIAGLCALMIRPARLLRTAVVLKPSTLMGFHRALVKRNFRPLFTPRQRGTPGREGRSPELVDAILEMRRRNPGFRCASLILRTHWVMVVMDQFTRRIVGSVPDVPLSHPFVERLVGTIRREFLDQGHCQHPFSNVAKPLPRALRATV